MTPAEFTDRFDYDPDNDLLGEGGFGKIFKAWDNVRNEYIALKMSKVQPGMEEFSLLSEYERVKHLEHPNIARYIDCQRIKLPGIGTHDIALMKYYEHGNLSQLLSKHTLTQGQKQKVVDGLLEGIGYLHRLRPMIIHSDLKPSNILIVERRGFFIPLITDFGISRQAKVDDKSYVTNTIGAGTYAYAAPEQWEAKELRPNADLWSFAIMVIYVWFNGKKLPFRADDISIATESGRIEYMKRVIALDFIPDLKDLPDPYKTIVQACLVVNPQARIRSVDELLGKLRQHNEVQMEAEEFTQVLPHVKPNRPPLIQADEKTEILKDEQTKPTPKPVVQEIEKPQAPVEEPKQRSNRAVWIAAGLTGAAILGGGSWYAMQRPEKPKEVSVAAAMVALLPKKDSVAVALPAAEAPKPITKKEPVKEVAEKRKPEPVKERKEGSVYHVVEDYPRFPGGTSAMNAWLASHLHTPESAERSFVSGIVRLSFIVNIDGTRENIQVVRGLGYGCDEEAIRLVKAMPNWIPGRTMGRSVRVQHQMGITFE